MLMCSYGCCPFANGICCPGGYTCCPAGTVCHNVVNNSWSTVSECVSPQTSVPGMFLSCCLPLNRTGEVSVRPAVMGSSQGSKSARSE